MQISPNGFKTARKYDKISKKITVFLNFDVFMGEELFANPL